MKKTMSAIVGFMTFIMVLESMAQEPPRRRQQRQKNQSACYEGGSQRRVPCPRNGEVFPRPNAPRDGDGYVDGSDRWRQRSNQKDFIERVCHRQRRGEFATPELLEACKLGVRAARVYGRKVGSAVGHMEGFKYGVSIGLDDGSYEAEFGTDRRGRPYADGLIEQGRDQYDGNIRVRDPYVIDQLKLADRQLSIAVDQKEADGISYGSGQGRQSAQAQFVDYTLGRTNSKPNKGKSDDYPDIEVPYQVDPFASAVGYSTIQKIIREQILELPPSGFGSYYQDQNELYHYLTSYYGDGRLGYGDMYYGRNGRYQPRKNAYIPKNPNEAFQVMIRRTRRSNGRVDRRNRDDQLSGIVKRYDALPGKLELGSGRIPGASKKDWVVKSTEEVCKKKIKERYPNTPEGVQEAREKTVSLGQSFCLCDVGTPAPGGGTGDGRTNNVCLVASFGLPDGMKDRVSGKTAFHMGFVGAFRQFFDHNYQRSFADSSENAYDVGEGIGFRAGVEKVVEQGRAQAFERDFNIQIADAYEDGFESGYKSNFESVWESYNTNAVLEVRTVALTGSLGESVFRPDESLSAVVEVTNYGGVAADLSASVSGSAVVPGNTQLLPTNVVPALTARETKSLTNFAVVRNPLNPVKGIVSKQVSLNLSPQRGSSKNALWNFSLEEWVSLAGYGLEYKVDYNSRTGTVSVAVKNNSSKHETPQMVTAHLLLDGQRVGTDELGMISKNSVEEGQFQLSNLTQLNLLEGSHVLGVEVVLGGGDLVIKEGGFNIQVDDSLVRATLPSAVNNILLDSGRVTEGLESQYGYLMKTSPGLLGETMNRENASIFSRRAIALANKYVSDEIRDGIATKRYSVMDQLVRAYKQSHNYISAPGAFRSGRYETTNSEAMNRVATAQYIIDYSNMARVWYETADRYDRREEGDLKDLLKENLAIHKDREEGRKVPRIVPWEKKDMYEVPRGKGPSKKKIRFFWLDGNHPGLVMATEDMNGFIKYFNGDKGGDLKLPRHAVRRVSDW